MNITIIKKKPLVIISGVFFISCTLIFFLLSLLNIDYRFIKPSVTGKSIKKPRLKIQPLSLEKIFFGNKEYLNDIDPSDLVTVVATGDLIFARMVNAQESAKNDFTWPMASVSAYLKSADLTIGNLESPLLPGCPVRKEGMNFCGSDKNIENLIQSGIDLVTIANNHFDNEGEDGKKQTLALLAKNGILATGITGPTYLAAKGLTFGFLGYNFLEGETEERLWNGEILKEIDLAKQKCDVLIVLPHWGEEYQEIPSAFEQTAYSEIFKAGADIIIGNHPHIIQPVKVENGKTVFFALGNFVFDQMWSEKTTIGMAVKLFFYDQRIIDVEFYPVKIRDFGQAVPMDKQASDEFKKELYQLSLQPFF